MANNLRQQVVNTTNSLLQAVDRLESPPAAVGRCPVPSTSASLPVNTPSVSFNNNRESYRKFGASKLQDDINMVQCHMLGLTYQYRDCNLSTLVTRPSLSQ